MRKALIKQPSGLVVNVIEIEDGATWQPPVGHTLIDAATTGSPGDTWDGAQFISPIVLLLPDPAIAISAAAADVVTEIDKAFTVRATPLAAEEKAGMRDKVVALIAKAQGR